MKVTIRVEAGETVFEGAGANLADAKTALRQSVKAAADTLRAKARAASDQADARANALESFLSQLP